MQPGVGRDELIGCDVLVQSEAAMTCEGFRGVAPPRPVRILVRAGNAAAATPAVLLVDALVLTVSSLGTRVPTPEVPCGGVLRDLCMAQSEPQTLNFLAWVGSADPPDAGEDDEIDRWLDSQVDAAAVAVVPQGVNPDTVVPARLRDRQVVRWISDASEAALDVVAATEVVTSDRRVFVSYSHTDGIELAHAVFRCLSEARFSVFMDSFALTPGADFAERIEHELLDKAFMILVETPHAVISSWVLREIAFARQHRLGIASVWPGGPMLAGIGRARRWDVPGGEPNPSPEGPVFAPPAANDLRNFVTRLHGETLLRRRQTLVLGVRAALRGVGVRDKGVTNIAGGLAVEVSGDRWAISVRPRPAQLIDMRAAADQAAPAQRALMVSATPRGRPEREALAWLAGEACIPRWDEGRLLSLARRLVAGTLR